MAYSTRPYSFTTQSPLLTYVCLLGNVVLLILLFARNQSKPLRPVTVDNPAKWVSQPASDSSALENQYQQWLKTYRAADPAYQSICAGVLQNGAWPSAQEGSQFGQDVFLFFNLYKYWPMQGKKGFYVDSGANDAREISNTLFFDKCLGWLGLCVEPQSRYHADIKQHRSCQLIPECIDDKNEFLSLSGGGGGASVGAAVAAGQGVKCSPLSDMLSRSSNSSRRHVDFWSLDVEGFEMTVLGGVNFNEITVTALLIEDFWISSRDLDLFMTGKPFYKYQQLAIDALYVKRGTHLPNAEKVWYPPKWEQDIELNQKFRRSAGVVEQLMC